MDEIISYKMYAVKARNAKLQNYLKGDLAKISFKLLFIRRGILLESNLNIIKE